MFAILDDEAPRRGAALAGGEICRLDRDGCRGIDVFRVPDDERIVAAKLEARIFCGFRRIDYGAPFRRGPTP
jgi:hypothetical protein